MANIDTLQDPLGANKTLDPFFDYAGDVSLDPISLRRIFLLLTRNLYADPENHFGYSNPEFKKFKYSDNIDERAVAIDISFDDDPRAEAGPELEIDIHFGPFKVEPILLDKYVSTTDTNKDRQYNDRITTQMIIQHRAFRPDDALGMGYITANFYTGIRKLLQERLFLLNFQVDQISDVKRENEEANAIYKVDTISTLVFNMDQDVSEESHKLRKISFDLGFKD